MSEIFKPAISCDSIVIYSEKALTEFSCSKFSTKIYVEEDFLAPSESKVFLARTVTGRPIGSFKRSSGSYEFHKALKHKLTKEERMLCEQYKSKLNHHLKIGWNY